jgi:hypothetical protein
VLARLWRREVEAVSEQPPCALLQLPLIAALPESPHTPPLDSRQRPRKTRRTANPSPIMRLWIPGEETPPPRRRTPQDHADRLLCWVRENGCSGGAVLAMDLQKIYPAMCEQLDWKPHTWQPVACELRKLTGKRKSYRWVDGHRRRVYRIPKA